MMLTSSDLDHEIKMAYELGTNSFLTKPVDLDRLVEMVKNASSPLTGVYSGSRNFPLPVI